MLSKRLQSIYSLIEKGQNVADIGCDHGYLLIELYKNNISDTLLGVDNKIGPLKIAEENIKKERFTSNINLSLSDGLDVVTVKYNCVVLAGLGSDTIIKIIENNIKKLDFIDTFIVDSHTDIENIRRFFVNHNYYIDKEILLMEKGILYTIIRFKKGKTSYNNLEYKYGPYLLKNKDSNFLKIYNDRIEYLKNTLLSQTNKKYIEKLNSEILELEKIINY